MPPRNCAKHLTCVKPRSRLTSVKRKQDQSPVLWSAMPRNEQASKVRFRGFCGEVERAPCNAGYHHWLDDGVDHRKRNPTPAWLSIAQVQGHLSSHLGKNAHAMFYFSSISPLP
eukprot:g35151.t1